MKLFMSGRRAEVKPKLPPSMVKIKRALDSSVDGELFTTQQLAQMVGHTMTTIHHVAYLLPAYWHNYLSARKYWGKPATIRQLRKELRKR